MQSCNDLQACNNSGLGFLRDSYAIYIYINIYIHIFAQPIASLVHTQLSCFHSLSARQVTPMLFDTGNKVQYVQNWASTMAATRFTPRLYFHALKSKDEVTCQVLGQLIQVNSRLLHKFTHLWWSILIIVLDVYQTVWTRCLSHSASWGFLFPFISAFDTASVFWDACLSCTVNSIFK